MYWSKILKMVLILAVMSLIVPMSIAWGQTTWTGTVSDSGSAPDGSSDSHQLNLNDKITLSLSNLAQPGEGESYEAWLIADDGSSELSLGVLTVDADGSVSQSYTHPSGENLYSIYNKLSVTLDGNNVFAHQLSEGGTANVRNLLFSATGNPAYSEGPHEGTAKGSAVGLQEQTGTLLNTANEAVSATTIADLQAQACQFVNAAEGSAGANFSASCDDPGDGHGALVYAADVAAEADAAAGATDTNITSNAAGVAISARNVTTWISEARDNAVLASDTSDLSVAQTYMVNAQTLANRSLKGFDADRNGSIGSIVGEGGARQAYIGAQNMAEYAPTVLTGDAALPKSGDVNLGFAALMALVAGVAMITVGGLALYNRTRMAKS